MRLLCDAYLYGDSCLTLSTIWRTRDPQRHPPATRLSLGWCSTSPFTLPNNRCASTMMEESKVLFNGPLRFVLLKYLFHYSSNLTITLSSANSFQLHALRRLMQGGPDSPKAPLGNNFRPPQPLLHRPVRTNIDFLANQQKTTVNGKVCPTMSNSVHYKGKRPGHEVLSLLGRCT